LALLLFNGMLCFGIIGLIDSNSAGFFLVDFLLYFLNLIWFKDVLISGEMVEGFY